MLSCALTRAVVAQPAQMGIVSAVYSQTEILQKEARGSVAAARNKRTRLHELERVRSRPRCADAC